MLKVFTFILPACTLFNVVDPYQVNGAVAFSDIRAPLAVIVDACRVDGIAYPEPGTNPLMLETVKDDTEAIGFNN